MCMPKYMIIFFLAFSDVLLLLGCQSPQKAMYRPTTLPAADLILESLDPQFDNEMMQEWGVEAVQRFGHKVVVVGAHGWYTVAGEWLVMPRLLNSDSESDRPWPVENLIEYEKAEHPGYQIVLLCCNVDSIVLHGYPNVWYAPNEVWIVPDADCPPNKCITRSLQQPKVIGSIEGFVSAK